MNGIIHQFRYNLLIQLKIEAESKPIAIVELNIKSVSYFIDRSYECFFYEHEHSNRTFVATDLIVPSLIDDDINGSIRIDENRSWNGLLYVKCADESVICSLHKMNGSTQQLTFSYKAGRAAERRTLKFIIFDDQYYSNVLEIWQVTCNTLCRVEVDSVYGQTSESALKLVGQQTSCQVRGYSTNPREIGTSTKAPLILPPNSLFSIPLQVRPAKPDRTSAIINVVNMESKTLLASYMVIAKMSVPNVTKMFQIKLQKGTSSKKRVSYSNPFKKDHKIFLKTSHPELLDFKETALAIEAQQKVFICLKFKPCQYDTAEIYVFLNNELGKLEECLLVKVSYT